MTMRISGSGPVPWLPSKVADPLLHILRKGAERKQLAFSAAFGITLGMFPICVLDLRFWSYELKVSVFLCGVAIALLGSRCHVPSVILFNFMAQRHASCPE